MWRKSANGGPQILVLKELKIVLKTKDTYILVDVEPHSYTLRLTIFHLSFHPAADYISSAYTAMKQCRSLIYQTTVGNPSPFHDCSYYRNHGKNSKDCSSPKSGILWSLPVREEILLSTPKPIFLHYFQS